MKACRLGLVCALAVLLTSCGSKPQDLIVGKWETEQEGMKMSFEFAKDGKMKMSIMGITADGKYKWVDNENIETEISTPAGVETEKVKVEVTKAELKATGKDGKTIAMKRVS